ncbi:hypothetical protein IEQ11_08180 [Lysobacter capsici]|uniref:hypothetical protein n=1 Tax=Lysobacter capsici TaxID=435897 RepID=UPI00177CB6B6|nr:hypothetical protein [Lysobacter capsici]UOF16609.1 hypothetical protein IEQ11_08180 [Lysobacter capsici]
MDTDEFLKLLGQPFGLGAGAVVAVYVVQWVLRRLGAGGDAYAAKKGQNLATKEDLADAVKQLKEFEETRAAVAHEDWVAREWKAVRARHLEAFEGGLQESYDYAQDLMQAAIFTAKEGLARNDGGVAIRLRTLQKLYYPELAETLTKFQGIAERLRILGAQYEFLRRQEPPPLDRIEKVLSTIEIGDADLRVALEECSSALAEVAKIVFNVTRGDARQR